MLNFRPFGTLAGVLTIVVVIGAATTGVYGQLLQPGPAPIPYPGQIAPCPGCCPGPCMCVPNVCTWGHFQKKWCPWPGDRFRADINAPDLRGLENVLAPAGEKPKPLPREEYAPPETETEEGPGVQIQQGPATGPIETTPQMDFGPGFGEGLPGLDVTPQGPSPDQGPAKETPKEMPKESPPPAPEPTVTPSNYSIPPAPTVDQTVMAPPALPRHSDDAYLAPPSPPQAEVPASELPGAIAWEPPADSQAEPPAPLPTANELPELTPPELHAAAPAPMPPMKEPAALEAAPLPETRAVDYKEPVGKTTLGLDGYCPVELVRHEQWVEGDPRWTVEYQGRTYQMSGPAQHRLFRAEPGRYAPVLAGCDPVLAATGKRLVAGRTDASVIYQGRLYMFSSQETLAQFRRDPSRFTAKAPSENK